MRHWGGQGENPLFALKGDLFALLGEIGAPVASLMSGGSDPVITMAPQGAWTHAITDKALK